MPIPSSSKSRSDILKRCQEDEITRLRLRYDPYYNALEKQEGSKVWFGGKEMIMLSSNDYLGLGNHPKVIEAGKKALDKWGAGTTGARVANGSRSFHVELEEKLAAFLGKEACHVSVAGYISCMSAIEPFARKGDVILVDRSVHSSLWAGITLTGARVERFSHNNPEALVEALNHESDEDARILVLEGVYSMEGDIAKLPEFMEAVRDQNIFIVLDDAHGLGVLGREGRGTADHFGVTEDIDIIAGSMSKALSSTGGFVAGSRDVIEYLRTYSRQIFFSAALSPSQTACAQAALEVMQEEPEHKERLWENTQRYKESLAHLNLNTWGSETPAVPIVLGTTERTYLFWKALMSKGIFANMILAPAVPAGKEMIRTAISASHTEEDLERIAEAMAAAAKHL